MASRYSSASSPSPSPSATRRHYSAPMAATAAGNPSRAIATKTTGHNNLGSMVKKFIEKRSSGSKKESKALAIPVDPIAGDLKRAGAAKVPNLSSLHRKLFHKAGSSDRTAAKALPAPKERPSTRTLAMVLRSERELMDRNRECEAEISELRILIEERNREVEKLKDLCLEQREEIKALKNPILFPDVWNSQLKDLCLEQREEIKALKDAILFPDVWNSQLKVLVEKQSLELKQARQVIPTLEKQVSSLTGQLKSLAEDLAEVKEKNHSTMSFNGHPSSPKTPILFQEAANSMEYSSGDPWITGPGSSDDLFLKDVNPCLTPCFSKAKSKGEMLGYDSTNDHDSFQENIGLSPDMSFHTSGGKLSKSSDHRLRPRSDSAAQKVHKSDENKWSAGKPRLKKLF